MNKTNYCFVVEGKTSCLNCSLKFAEEGKMPELFFSANILKKTTKKYCEYCRKSLNEKINDEVIKQIIKYKG